MDGIEVEEKKTLKELYKVFCGKNVVTLVENTMCTSLSVAEETYGFTTTIYGVCGKNESCVLG